MDLEMRAREAVFPSTSTWLVELNVEVLIIFHLMLKLSAHVNVAAIYRRPFNVTALMS